jgi:LDH2 family malate/lactate/ureidoglycolate dehydrogenase
MVSSSASGSPRGVRVDAEELEGFAARAFVAAGLDDADAAASAHVLVRTSLRGVDSHGIWFLDRYIRQLQAGGAKRRPAISPVADLGALLVLDGDAGLGLAIATHATQEAIDRSGSFGLSLVSVRNANHFGAAGHYALMCAEAGRIGLVLANTAPIMAATGGRTRVLGNSPLAFGAPRAGGPPFVLDIAMSRVAGGKIRMALEKGEQVPPGWIIDPEGQPTTAPEDFFVKRGALLPMEGHKGYGLALMIETLTGVLSGAGVAGQVGNWLYSPETPTDTGFFLLVIDVGAGGPFAAFQDRLAGLCEQMVSAPRAPSVERILVPGELEHERETAAREHGLPLRDEIWSALEGVAAQLGLTEQLSVVAGSHR